MTSERMGNSCFNWPNILGALLLGCALISTGTWAQTAPSPREAKPMANNPAVEARLVDISQELRCMVCQNESLASSHAELAEDLRREVRDLIVQGKTDSEIKTFLVDRYGDFVLYRPEVKPLTWVLWFGPFFLLLLAAVAMGAYLRQRKKQVTSLELSDAQRERAEQLLKGKP
jgi:cytochrome c-type biogenesis protein CcmH